MLRARPLLITSLLALVATLGLLALPTSAAPPSERRMAVWSIPNGTLIVGIDGDIFVASFRYDPYMGREHLGYMKGSVSGGTLDGEYVEIDEANRPFAHGFVTYALKDDKSLDATVKNEQHETVATYNAAFRRAATEDDLATWTQIQKHVQEAMTP